MGPAGPGLGVLEKALSGDAGARAFLDRTSSIYVLDATDPANPKTYGCWQFIHQALNEIERYESGTNGCRGAGIVDQVQILVTMALHVARRTPAVDKGLVATCIANASQYNGTGNHSQRLIRENVDLREIVMGRIASIVFDFSFHKNTGHHEFSVFANSGVMEGMCAVLAANAVSSGPSAIRHFVLEWVVPSARTLPPYALACVSLHLASEAIRNSSPAGTKDMLQRLSAPTMSVVLCPVLASAVAESNLSSDGSSASREQVNRIVVIALRAINRWCAETDLSLAQIKYLCGKVQINVIEVMSDAMYSDSRLVIDALAELIEDLTRPLTAQNITRERMNQVRYIMNVDEASFHANVSRDQLVAIDNQEMASVTDELLSAIGLQRFRFGERQTNGDHEICRNLARIAAAVCLVSVRTGQLLESQPGVLELLMSAATNSVINVCAVALEALTQVIPGQPGLVQQLLPILQRRAITPHNMIAGFPFLTVADVCEADYQGFYDFREQVLTPALIGCWKQGSTNFMDSCTCAVEEFCSDKSTNNVSFHLEAALFCLAAVAEEVIADEQNLPLYSQLQRCTAALSCQPPSTVSNPYTLAQMCRFIREYVRWYEGRFVEGSLGVAAKLALSTFTFYAANPPSEGFARHVIRETGTSPLREAALTLREILCRCPGHFVSNEGIGTLSAAWEASYAASNRANAISVEDRAALCFGLCHVFAAIPEAQREKSFHALALFTMNCLESMMQRLAATVNQGVAAMTPILDRVADEIRIVTAMAKAFTSATASIEDSCMLSGCRTSPDRHAIMKEPEYSIIRRAWPSISHAAAAYSYHENLSQALGGFLVACLPRDCQDDESLSRLTDFCALAESMLKASQRIERNMAAFHPVLTFLEAFVNAHCGAVERSVDVRSGSVDKEIGGMLKNLFLRAVEAVRDSLGNTWTSSKEQGQGQPAFESKTDFTPKHVSNDALPGVFSFLKVLVKPCPSFFLGLPLSLAVVDSSDGGHGPLFHRAVESAVASLTDTETCASAIAFLESVVILCRQRNLEEPLSRLMQDIVIALMTGICGVFGYTTLPGATDLLYEIVSPPSANVGSVLQLQTQPQFLKQYPFLVLTETRNVLLRMLERAARREIGKTDLRVFVEEIWMLHQTEDLENIIGTDVVIRFVEKHRV